MLIIGWYMCLCFWSSPVDEMFSMQLYDVKTFVIFNVLVIEKTSYSYQP